MYRAVSNEEVAAFDSLCTKLAWRLTGIERAEFDDLRQEGLIAVWLALRDGFRPTKTFIENRMFNWVDKCRRKGFTGYEQEDLSAEL